jgi:hypothetical protein
VPYVPALGVLATTQLIASLGALAWARFVVYTVLCSALYVWYGAAGIRGGWGPGSDGRLDAFRVMRESDDEGDAEGGDGDDAGRRRRKGRSRSGSLWRSLGRSLCRGWVVTTRATIVKVHIRTYESTFSRE